jgi:TolB-like protein
MILQKSAKDKHHLPAKAKLFVFAISFVCVAITSYAQEKGPKNQLPSDTAVVQKTQAATLPSKVEELAKQIYETMLAQNGKKVAVLPLSTLTGESTVLGLFVSDKLTSALFKFKDKFEVVDRIHLEQILKELKLSQTGAIEPATAQKLGKLLGADAIVAGTITDLGSDVDITTRVLGTEQGNVLAVASIQFIKDSSIEKLLNEEIREPEKPKTTEASKPVATQTTESKNEIIIQATDEELKTWKIEGGRWIIQQDILPNGEQGNVISQKSFDVNCLAFFGNPSWTNYIIEFFVKIVDLDQQQTRHTFKVYFRAQDKDNSYFLLFQAGRTSYPYLYIYSQIDGIRRQIAGTSNPADLDEVGKWYHIKITLLGNNLQCYVDDNLFIEHKEIASSMGMLGFETSATKISIANLKVRIKSSTVYPKSKGR